MIFGISRRFTITCRPFAIPPAVCKGSVPLNHVTIGSGRPVEWNIRKKNKKCAVVRKKYQRIDIQKKIKFLDVINI